MRGAPGTRIVAYEADGLTVVDGRCVNDRPADSDTAHLTSDCTYFATEQPWSACSGETQTRTVSCTHADGEPAAAAQCGREKVEHRRCVNRCTSFDRPGTYVTNYDPAMMEEAALGTVNGSTLEEREINAIALYNSAPVPFRLNGETYNYIRYCRYRDQYRDVTMFYSNRPGYDPKFGSSSASKLATCSS